MWTWTINDVPLHFMHPAEILVGPVQLQAPEIITHHSVHKIKLIHYFLDKLSTSSNSILPTFMRIIKSSRSSPVPAAGCREKGGCEPVHLQTPPGHSSLAGQNMMVQGTQRIKDLQADRDERQYKGFTPTKNWQKYIYDVYRHTHTWPEAHSPSQGETEWRRESAKEIERAILTR